MASDILKTYFKMKPGGVRVQYDAKNASGHKIQETESQVGNIAAQTELELPEMKQNSATTSFLAEDFADVDGDGEAERLASLEMQLLLSEAITILEGK